MENETKIIITTYKFETALHIIAKSAVKTDRIKILYEYRYAPTIELLIRTLRTGFGWLENERGEEDIPDLRCSNSHRVSDGIYECHNQPEGEKKKCDFDMRKDCKSFKSKSESPIKAQYIVIEKAGGIRGL